MGQARRRADADVLQVRLLVRSVDSCVERGCLISSLQFEQLLVSENSDYCLRGCPCKTLATEVAVSA